MTETIYIDLIDRGAGTQSRAGLDGPTVYDYAEAMHAGTKFPPVDLIYDGARYFLKDGFHRVAAALQLELTTIEANVEQGTLEDAQWASYGVNSTHGLRRSREDTQRAITAALKHPNGAGKSDRAIARHVGVGHATVGRVRQKLQTSGSIDQIGERQVTRGGQTYTQNTANIGGSQTELSLEERFPLDCYVRLTNNRVMRVVHHQNDHLFVVDPMLPNTQPVQELMVDKRLRQATQIEIDVYCHPPFPVGSKVVVNGSPTVATVTDTIIGWVAVIYGDDRSGHPFLVELKNVCSAPAAESKSGKEAFDPVRNALERAYVYRGNDTEGWHLYAFGNYQGREGLDQLVNEGLIEAQHYEKPNERLRITVKGCEWLGKPLASWMGTEDSEEENPILTPTDGLRVGDWVVVKNGPARKITEIVDDKYIWATGYGRTRRSVVTKIDAPDADGPYNNGTLDDYREEDEQANELPPAPYSVGNKLHGGLGIFDAEGHVFMYFVGLTEATEKQLGEYLVNTLNSIMCARAE